MTEVMQDVIYETGFASIAMIGIPNELNIACRTFQLLMEANIMVDMIAQGPRFDGTVDLSFAVREEDLGKAERLLEPVASSMGIQNLVSKTNLAKISVVNLDLTDMTDIAVRIFGTLAEGGINTSAAITNETRFTCLIPEREIERAIRMLRSRLNSRIERATIS